MGGKITYSLPTATDGRNGAVVITCNPASGSTLPLKTTTVNCEATDAAGNTAHGSFVISVTFPQWSGILRPINRDGSSIFKLGSTIPIKFELPIPGGGFVTDAAPRLFIAKVSNSIVSGETEAATSTPASSGNDTRLDGNQYIYNLGKKNVTPYTYQLRIDTGDGINTNSANIAKEISDIYLIVDGQVQVYFLNIQYTILILKGITLSYTKGKNKADFYSLS
jgi:hypothetical protein